MLSKDLQRRRLIEIVDRQEKVGKNTKKCIVNLHDIFRKFNTIYKNPD